MKSLKNHNNIEKIYSKFNFKDPFLLEEQLSQDEILIRNTARSFAQKGGIFRIDGSKINSRVCWTNTSR